MAKNKNIEGDNAKENEGFRLLKEAFKEKEGIEIIKNEDRETQLKGIDFEFDMGGKHRICDEKFAADYINKHLPTFCLELASKPTSGIGEYKKGWFIDEEKVTDTYLFKWLDNGKMEVIVVDRKRLTDEILKKGWTLESLYDHALKIGSGQEREGYKDGLKFSVAKYKPEKGVTIILTRDFYRRICDFAKTYDVDDTEMLRLCEKYKSRW